MKNIRCFLSGLWRTCQFCLILPFLLIFVLVNAQAQNPVQRNRGYDSIINGVAKKHNVEASLIHSIIQAESDYDREAVSSKGAVGLMQLMPLTAKQYGVKNLYDPQDNIEGGVRYLKDLIKLFNGKTHLVLAGYNAGQEAIRKYGGIPPYPETIDYIKKVMNSYPKSFIRPPRTFIYKYYDESGKLVLTNSRQLYLMNKKEAKAD